MTNDTQQWTHLQPDIIAYLQRIGFTGDVGVNADTLSRLQECHIHSVPYENLDILHGVPISLEIPRLFDKIVTRRRGGYCFELNALFGWLLAELGFEVVHYFSRFWRDETDTPPKRRHHILQVTLDGERYLSDVGVGGIVPRRPLRMMELEVQQQGSEIYRMERDAEFGWLLCEQKGETWHRIYSFTEEPQLPKDYVMASFWCEHAPESIFKQLAIAAIRTEEGRNTIAGEEFRIFTADGVQVFKPETDEAYREALKTHFGIELH
ncbi:arylamine N-acetyltransferase family protein [Paenibacillus radicis (ex Gao et al. 2016)]|uniref:Acetyltransferase n=1 Tax=Paenibacillus radicis (ex Gao et al. 2016) TaxID=1737354 RepID=A0A917LZN3_9BACL|nr:arylamine N-acetyltransferase [Paenibacillus radicis (ex Gao et al. 2016)]GGG66267.1 acetyltransferase [Paenibacillus radicis (ex Gao et al. 2016)]